MHTVDEIMSPGVKTAKVQDVVGPLRDLMLEENLHAVPVLDHNDELVGIVTSSDLVEEWAPTMGVLSVMSPDVCTVGPHTSVVDAARRMVERRFHHLVVVDRSHVVGIVSSFDLIRHLAGEVEHLSSAPSTTRVGALRANVGDVIVVLPKHLGEKERRATVVRAHGEGGTAPFTVRWADDPHDEPRLPLFFPSNDAYVETAANRGTQ